MVKSQGYLKILFSDFEMVDLLEPSAISTGTFLNLEAPGGVQVSESSAF